MAWTEYILALAAFLISHALPARPPLRPWLVARLSERGFILAYSLLSLVLLGWLISAAGRAPHVLLWEQATWHRHLAIAAMLPVCLMAALAVGRPNPFSFGGARNCAFDPAIPGLVRWIYHPLLVALALWAFVHLLANGDLAHVLLFGLFAIFALAGQRLVTGRRRKALGDEWGRLSNAMRTPVARRPAFAATEFMVRIAAGLALYAALLELHPLLFGVDPLA